MKDPVAETSAALLRLGLLFGSLLFGSPVHGHTSSTGLARLEVLGDEASYRLTLAPAEIGDAAMSLQRGALGDPAAAQQAGVLLRTHLVLAVDGEACRIKRTRLQASQLGDERVALLLDWQCPRAPGTLVLRDTLGTPFGEHYRSIVSISQASAATAKAGAGGATGSRHEYIFDREHPELRIELGHAPPSGFGAFVRLGMSHILSGMDHLLFLAALLLGSRGLRSLLITVTAFTAAHSLSTYP